LGVGKGKAPPSTVASKNFVATNHTMGSRRGSNIGGIPDLSRRVHPPSMGRRGSNMGGIPYLSGGVPKKTATPLPSMGRRGSNMGDILDLSHTQGLNK